MQASLLGRAYALLADQNVETDHPYLRDLEEADYVGSEWTSVSGMEPDQQTSDVKRQTAELLSRKFEAHTHFGGEGHVDGEDPLPLSIFSMLPIKLHLRIYRIDTENLQRRRLWSVISSTFIKALFGSDPEPLARYCVGTHILICGRALSRIRHIMGKGTEWSWRHNEIVGKEDFWPWADVEQVIMRTEDLLRHTRDVTAWMDSMNSESMYPMWASPGESLHGYVLLHIGRSKGSPTERCQGGAAKNSDVVFFKSELW